MLHDAPTARRALITAPISSRAWTVYNRCAPNSMHHVGLRTARAEQGDRLIPPEKLGRLTGMNRSKLKLVRRDGKSHELPKDGTFSAKSDPVGGYFRRYSGPRFDRCPEGCRPDGFDRREGSPGASVTSGNEAAFGGLSRPVQRGRAES